jgi:hypothetical protein
MDSPFAPLQRRNAKEIEYYHFVSVYYPRFSDELRSQVEAATMYTEIMSSIKGSLFSVISSQPLSPEQYEDFANQRHSKVDRATRAIIYENYLRYEKMKEERNEFDMEDVVMHLIQQFRLGKYTGVYFSDISIDEVQDLSPSMICMFKYLCKDNSGFVFAGEIFIVFF